MLHPCGVHTHVRSEAVPLRRVEVELKLGQGSMGKSGGEGMKGGPPIPPLSSIFVKKIGILFYYFYHYFLLFFFTFLLLLFYFIF